MEIDWSGLFQKVASEFRLPKDISAHAEDHWGRVALYGQLLGEASAGDRDVIALFAMLHDSQRFEETHDPEHGPRAARFAELMQGRFYLLQDRQLQLLSMACRDHERGYTVSEPTIGSCWDSDRLDLDRVGIAVDPGYLSTDTGKRLALIRPLDRRQKALEFDKKSTEASTSQPRRWWANIRIHR